MHENRRGENTNKTEQEMHVNVIGFLFFLFVKMKNKTNTKIFDHRRTKPLCLAKFSFKNT